MALSGSPLARSASLRDAPGKIGWEDAMETRALDPFGVEIVGLDLTKELAPETVAEIQRLFYTHGILLLRRAAPDSEAHMRLSRCFGEPMPAATGKLNAAENPALMWLITDPANQRRDTINLYETGGRVRAGWLGWHWDQAFMPEIVRGAVLRMIEPAVSDGETGFISAIAAYERLPQALKDRIQDLEIVYHFTGQQERNRFGYPADLRVVERTPEADESSRKFVAQFPPVVHPLVITQIETGRKILKLSPMHAKYVLGLGEAESDALLTEIAAHLVDERHAFYHSWDKDDLIVWDNWQVVHSARGVPPGVVRRAQRTTISGDYKLGRYLDPATDPARHTARVVD